MAKRQAHSPLKLQSRRVGALPIVNSFLQRLRFEQLLEKTLPHGGRVAPGKGLGVLLRNITLNDRCKLPRSGARDSRDPVQVLAAI